MRAIPRERFIPRAHRAQANVDMPLRVTALEFNVSAPHMYAAALCALDIQPGDTFLDIGWCARAPVI